MAHKKILALILLAAMSGAIGPAATSLASDRFDRWHSYTSTSQIRYVDYFDDSLQVVSSGGWLKIDPRTLGMKKITNTDGIGTNDLYYIMKDAPGSIWLAGYGRLIHVLPDDKAVYLFFDRNNDLQNLYSLADDGDFIWVGTSNGLGLFAKNIDGGQIEDFYYRFGNLDPEPAVNDVLVRGDSIWIATSAGLAVANKSNTNLLKSYASWTVFNRAAYPELLSDTVTSLAFFDGSLYIGTARGVYEQVIGDPDTSFAILPTHQPFAVGHMIVRGDSLVIYGSGGFYVHTASGTSGTLSGSDILAAGQTVDSVHWIGFKNKGLWKLTGSGSSRYNDGGLPGNLISALSCNYRGQVVGAFRGDGTARLDTTGWTRFSLNVGAWATSVVQDNSGNIWTGTWGNGLYFIRSDSIINYDENNSTLRGVSEGPAYVVANSLTANPRYLFISCYRALDGNPIAVVDLADRTQWESFGISQGITTDRIIAIDNFGNALAIGSENSGVYYYYYGPDPFYKGDDSVVNWREDNAWLGSNNINDIRFDPHGGVWAGTKFGLSRYDYGIERFVNVSLPLDFGPEITRMAFDRRGNLWLGSHTGLALYDPVSGEFTVFNILNSGLTNDYVTALMINPVTGDIWAGTAEGISILESPIGRPTGDIASVIAFPNPFIIGSGDEILSFNYSGEATVRIYSVAGELMKEVNVNDGWDGTNQAKSAVASGVYLYLLTAADGSVGRGKVLLIRK